MAITSSGADLSWSFPCGLRGYHVYRSIWLPVLHETIPTICERDNPYDRYAVAARKSLPGTLAVESTIGHLPKEICRFTSFLMLYGGIVVVKVLDTHHRRSPLVRGGLEIPVLLIVKMAYSPQNKDALLKYKSLVEEHYKEPVDGKFEDYTDAVLKELRCDIDEEDETDVEQVDVHDDNVEEAAFGSQSEAIDCTNAGSLDADSEQ